MTLKDLVEVSHCKVEVKNMNDKPLYDIWDMEDLEDADDVEVLGLCGKLNSKDNHIIAYIRDCEEDEEIDDTY